MYSQRCSYKNTNQRGQFVAKTRIYYRDEVIELHQPLGDAQDDPPYARIIKEPY